ncbi:acyltransferase [Tumebacillus sp. ITR2]|uniref:Acyltransferase n=1 Tax=Tumebacillus amylolyticus TaxID=2801339 RepID=A0ABS1JAL3_9BACL|nr:acyltransferase [Tumebacillus amylolyticus]MBL0387281.1 acyltransferase [Tumebacillus amylolyticus]
MNKKLRLHEIPHLRALAFIGVVVQHAIGMFSRSEGVQASDLMGLGVLFNLVKFAVPLFVFMTGLVIFYNYYEELKVGSYLVKRVREVIVPYLAFTVYYYYFWGADHAAHTWREFPSVFLTGSGAYHLWFVAMIFQFYLLYPVFRRAFQKLQPVMSRERVLISFLVVLVGVFIWGTEWVIGHSGQWKSDVFGIRGVLHHLDRTFVVWYLYFVLGGVAAMSIGKWRAWVARMQRWNLYVFGLTLGWVTLELSKGIQGGTMDLGVSHSFKASMILFTLSAFVLLYQVAMRMSVRENWATKVSNLLGKYSYGTYLMHVFFLDKLYYQVNKWMPGVFPVGKVAVAVVGCVGLSLVATMVISKVPVVGSLLVGTAGGRKKKVGSVEAVPAGPSGLKGGGV